MASRIKNIFFISVPVFALCFALLELYLRTKPDYHRLDELTGKKPVSNPMSEWAVSDAFSLYAGRPGTYPGGKTINTHGFISTPEIGLGKDSGTLRIVFLGGSSTAGTGVNLPDEETWPWKTADILRKKTGRKIDFINAAMGGYSTFESYGRLWSRLRFYKPDVIVVYHGWNDMYYFSAETASTPVQWRKHFSLDLTAPHQQIEPHPLDRFISWSRVLSRLRLLFIPGEVSGETRRVKPVLLDSFDRRGPQIFEENLRLIRSFADANGIRLWVCKQASLISRQTPANDRKRCKVDLHGFSYEAHLSAFDSIYLRTEKTVPASQIIDATSLSGRGSLFHDHIHLTEKGTDELARLVAGELMKNL